jgi:hypothetical protein
MSGKINRDWWAQTADDTARYRALTGANVRWRRPKAKDAAKSLDLPFLYTYGYDIASTHVHPMANDGQHEFRQITGYPGTPPGDQRVVVHNSILAHVLLVNEGVVASKTRWNRLLLMLIDDVRRGLSGNDAYKQATLDVIAAGPSTKWSELREDA